MDNWAEKTTEYTNGHAKDLWIAIELCKLGIDPVEIGKDMELNTEKILHHYQKDNTNLILIKKKEFDKPVIEYYIEVRRPGFWDRLARFHIASQHFVFQYNEYMKAKNSDA